jgi:hypothetical protein
MRAKGGLVLKASAIAPENTRDIRGKGPAGGKCAPYAPQWVLRVLLCGTFSTALLRRITHAAD